MRARRSGVAALVIGTALALAPLAAAASDADDTLRLAALAASGTGSSATVTLHALPTGWSSKAPLPDAPLIGSVEYERPGRALAGGNFFSIAQPTALYYDVGDRDRAVGIYRGALRTAGWRQVDLMRRFPVPRGGFAFEFPNPETWCSPAAPWTSVVINQPAFDGRALDLTISTSSNAESTCTQSEAFAFGGLSKSPLPTFVAVPGVAIDGAGPSGDGSTTRARIGSALGIAVVFETFAKQLRDAGWTAGDAAHAGQLRSQTFTKTVDGKDYVTLLSLTGLDATHYVALTNFTELPPR